VLTPITVAAPSKAWHVFASSNTAIVDSNPSQGLDVCVYSLFVLGSGHATGWSPSKGFYRLFHGCPMLLVGATEEECEHAECCGNEEGSSNWSPYCEETDYQRRDYWFWIWKSLHIENNGGLGTTRKIVVHSCWSKQDGLIIKQPGCVGSWPNNGRLPYYKFEMQI
jgi:hypothetical protein